jgi:hypothetical protein
MTKRIGPCELRIDRVNTRSVRWRCGCGSTGRWRRDSSNEHVTRSWEAHRDGIEGNAP